jgi:hypothetical protein
VAPLLLFAGNHTDHLDWIRQPSAGEFVDSLAVLAGRGGIPLLLAVVGLAAVGAAALPRPVAVSLVGWAAGPPFGLLVAGWVLQPAFQIRYVLACVPALVALAAVGAARFPAVRLRPALAGAAAVAFLAGAVAHSDEPRHDDFRAAGRIVSADLVPGGAVVMEPYGIQGLQRYLPAETRIVHAGSTTVEQVIGLVGDAPEVWVVTFAGTERAQRLAPVVAEHGRLTGTWTVTGLEVRRYAGPRAG